MKKEKSSRFHPFYPVTSVFLSLVIVFTLSSCWSRKDLGTLAIVLGTALDKADNPDDMKLTAQVVKPEQIGAGATGEGSSSSGEKAYANVTQTGTSMLTIVREITHMQSRKLYFAHNEVIIMSEDLARQGISNVLDGFTRDLETRMNVKVLVSRGEASKILEEDINFEKLPSSHIVNMLENQQFNSETVCVTLRDFSIATLSSTISPVAPIIEIHEVENEKYLRLQGTAIFKNGKMVGELSKDQTKGFMVVTNRAKSGVVTIETESGQVILEIFDLISHFKPVKKADGSFTMELNVEIESVLQSNETSEQMSTAKNQEMLKEKLNELITQEIESARNKAAQLSADIFGFGEAIERVYPKDWEKIKEDWDRIFKDIDLNINIKSYIRSTSGLSKKIAPGGAE